jgi:hypothetical protein
MQFLLYLYHNHVDFLPLSMSNEFLTALASTLFVSKLSSDIDSEIMSPVEEFRVSEVLHFYVLLTRLVNFYCDFLASCSTIDWNFSRVKRSQYHCNLILSECNVSSSNSNVYVIYAIWSLVFWCQQPFPASDQMVLINFAEKPVSGML